MQSNAIGSGGGGQQNNIARTTNKDRQLSGPQARLMWFMAQPSRPQAADGGDVANFDCQGCSLHCRNLTGIVTSKLQRVAPSCWRLFPRGFKGQHSSRGRQHLDSQKLPCCERLRYPYRPQVARHDVECPHVSSSYP